MRECETQRLNIDILGGGEKTSIQCPQFQDTLHGEDAKWEKWYIIWSYKFIRHYLLRMFTFSVVKLQILLFRQKYPPQNLRKHSKVISKMFLLYII